MYGSSGGSSSTVTRPCASQHCTVCPPTAMTRLTKSSSPDGATPIARPTASSAPVNQLDDGSTATSGSHVSGPRNTTTSPGSGSANQYGGLVTSTRSPVHPVQPCRVVSIEPEGMKNACTRKVLTRKASTSATTSSTGSSRNQDRRRGSGSPVTQQP